MKVHTILGSLCRAKRCVARAPVSAQKRFRQKAAGAIVRKKAWPRRIGPKGAKIYSRGSIRICKLGWEGSGKNVSALYKKKKERALKKKALRPQSKYKNNTKVYDTVSNALAKAQVDGVSPFVNPLYKKRPRYNSIMDIQLPFSLTEDSLTGIPEAWVWNRDKEKVGIIRLSTDIFCQPLRRDVLTRVVNFEMAQMRGWTKRKVLGRGEMPGSTKKVRPQKGQGKARLSDRRASHLHKGGMAGSKAVRPRNYEQKIPKKMRHLGFKVALSCRFKENRVFIWHDFMAETRKTKMAAEMYEKWGWDHQVLFVYAQEGVDRNFFYSVKNFPMIRQMPLDELSVHAILKHRSIVLTKEVADILCNEWSLEAEVQRWNMAAAANRAFQERFLDDAFPGETLENGNLEYAQTYSNGDTDIAEKPLDFDSLSEDDEDSSGSESDSDDQRARDNT